MINLYDRNLVAYKKEKTLNSFGGYNEDISDEVVFKAYTEDINDTEKYGDFGVDIYYDLKLVVSRGKIKNYKKLNYVVIDEEEYRIIKKNKYRLGNKEHIEMIVGLEVISIETD